MKESFQILVTNFLVGFGLNLAWEVLQTLVFFDFPWGNPKLFILIHLQATSADAAYIVLIYLLVMALVQDGVWLRRLTWFRIAMALLAGFTIAVVIEKKALDTGRWSYGLLMPLIPYLQVGLMPVLQMTILPITTFMISRTLLGLASRGAAGPRP